MSSDEVFVTSDLLTEIETLQRDHTVPINLPDRCAYSTEVMKLLLRYSEDHGVKISFDKIDEYRDQPPEGLLLLSFTVQGENDQLYGHLCVGVLERGQYDLKAGESLLFGHYRFIEVDGFYEIQRRVEPQPNDAGSRYSSPKECIYVNGDTSLCYIPCTPGDAKEIKDLLYCFN